jgi:hypothetical protein
MSVHPLALERQEKTMAEADQNMPKRPVGWKSPNDAADVEFVHRMLLTVPESKGGPPASFMARQPYSPETDKAILNFQKRQGLFADAVVSPGGATIKRIREMMSGHQQRHEYEPTTVTIIVTDRIIGHGYVKGYDGKAADDGSNLHPVLGRFRVPVYEMNVGVGQPSTGFTYRPFPVMRFGVRYRNEVAKAGGQYNDVFKVEGPPAGEFALTRVPYKVGRFAWQIKHDFLLHVGPDAPLTKGDDTPAGIRKVVSGIGCVMPVGPQSFQKLNSWIRECAFSDLYREKMISDDDADARIGKYKSLRCVIRPASAPPLRPLTDFREFGGPPPIAG